MRASPQERAGSAGRLATRGIGVASVRCFVSAWALTAAVFVFSAAPALAAPPTTFCPSGSESGQCSAPGGVAVDQSNGTIYVADTENHRVDEFDSAGHFTLAFGWGVADETTQALQTCTTSCFQGFQGAGAGEMRPVAIAIDNDPSSPSFHDLYVSDFASGNFRVQKFSPGGAFLLAFGWGVATGAAELQTCGPKATPPTATCQAGIKGAGPGQIGNIAPPLAVDDAGHVWVGDEDRLEGFSEAGAFLSELKQPGAREISSLVVDGEGDFYALTPPVLEVQGVTPPASGTYTLAFEGQTTVPLAFGADREVVQKALEGLSTIGPGNLEVLGSGVYEVRFRGELGGVDFPQLEISAGSVATLLDGAPARLAKLGPSGELLYTLDSSAPYGHPTSLGLDPVSGDLFVADQLDPELDKNFGNATILEYDSTGALIEAFGSGQVLGHPAGNSLAFAGAAQRLYVASFAGGESSAAQSFTLPTPGPLLREGSLAAKPRPTQATLKATLFSEGAATEYRFQYVSQKQFEEEAPGHGFDHATTTPTAELPADFSEHELSVPITGLTAETAYRFRLLAENANGKGNATGSEEATFTSLAPVLVDSESVSDVSATAATLEAELNTLGVTDEYRFEYLTEAAYQENLKAELDPFAGAAPAPVPDATIGASEVDQAVSQHVQGLTPSTVYRYRVFAHNPGGFKAGPPASFITQSADSLAGLPDSRQWELVSPPDKRGANIQPIGEAGVVQAAADGNAMTYLATAATEANPPANANQVQVLSARGPEGWASKNIPAPHKSEAGVSLGGGYEYRFFSADLSRSVLQPFGEFEPAISPEATEQTPFLRTDFPPGHPAEFCSSSCYQPLVSTANVPEGTKIAGGAECGEGAVLCGPKFLDATPDLNHVVLSSEVPLTEDGNPSGGFFGIYEWSAGQLAFVGLANGARNVRTISPDGRRIVFEGKSEALSGLLLRDTVGEKTVRLDAAEPQCLAAKKCVSGGGRFALASADASKVFFTAENRLTADSGAEPNVPDLYECAIEAGEEGKPSCALTDLTPKGPGGEAGDGRGVLGASEDGSWLYYEAGPKDAPHVYLRHGGSSTLVAVLDPLDSSDWDRELPAHYARVSPNGRWLAFMSQASPTGYDNRDAVSGVPDQEVYLYHAAPSGEAGQLLCASCNPSGARPHGFEYTYLANAHGNRLVAGGYGMPRLDQWLAASVPGWTPYALLSSVYQPRYLSDSGRLFFNSSDALLPGDTNGNEDVYQYEPPGAGDCGEGSPTFAAANGGCLGLISSGTSGEESAFLDASESGDDVFFLTTERLARRDIDSALDVYDARVGGGEAEPAEPPICEGDGCQQPAVPPNHPTPGTALLNGPENLLECRKGEAKKRDRCVAKQKHHRKHKAKKTKPKHRKRVARDNGRTSR